jgi:hypothetical protein
MNAESLPLAISEVDRDAPAPSPFLPGTSIQYAWDSTSLGYFKTCPRLYQYIMIEGWSPRDESIHLLFGQEFHTALEDFDRLLASGVPRGEAITAIIGDLLTRTKGWGTGGETKAEKYKNRDTLLSLVVDYLDHYKDDKAETFILEDGRPAVELSFRFELDWGPNTNPEQGFGRFSNDTQPYLLCGHLDRVVTYGGDLFVMDRKTATSTLSGYYFDQWEPSNQMTLYSLAAQVILGSPVRGVIIDAAQIMLEDPNRFVRGITYRTPDQLDEWTKDLQHWLAQAESYATARWWPMNDTACSMYGGCRFREVCSKSPGVRERFLQSGFIQKLEAERWNPLKVRI